MHENSETRLFSFAHTHTWVDDDEDDHNNDNDESRDRHPVSWISAAMPTAADVEVTS